MSRRHVVVVGDVVLDREIDGTVERLCPDAPCPVLDVRSTSHGPGGAGLAALLARGTDTSVTLVAPVADDDGGTLLRDDLAAARVELVALGHDGATRRKTRIRSGDHVHVRLDDGGPGAPLSVTADAARAIAEADVVLVSCYGAGTSGHPDIRAALATRIDRGGHVVWDPHPRGAAPVPGTTVVCPNRQEAAGLTGLAVDEPADLAFRMRRVADATTAVVTCGDQGAWLAQGQLEHPLYVPAATQADGDPCGAGDCFAATLAAALAHGATPVEAVEAAVRRSGDWVASGGAWAYRRTGGGVVVDGWRPSAASAQPDGSDLSVASAKPRTLPPESGRAPTTLAQAQALLSPVRAKGGTVVATGGCFDVLHAGHLQSLEAARRLGDALVVLVNSDASVRRLKGPGRPVQTAGDRARLLLGLSCVDAVVVFDEDDPRVVLEELRPDIWTKGADYLGQRLPEADLLHSWGGRVVLVPYLTGRSTTALLEAAG